MVLGNVLSQHLVPPTRGSEDSLHQTSPRGLATLQPLHQTHCQTNVRRAGVALDLVLATDPQLQGEGVPPRRYLVECSVEEW